MMNVPTGGTTCYEDHSAPQVTTGESLEGQQGGAVSLSA